jgi:hypothetical protein
MESNRQPEFPPPNARATTARRRYSKFDCPFRPYLERRYPDSYRQITDAITPFEYAEVLRMLQNRAHDLDVADEHFAIGYDTSVRYVFDRVCVELPDPLKSMTKGLMGKFFGHCGQIRAMTPSDLAEQLHGFIPHQRSQGIVDLFTQSPGLACVVEFISEIEFYSSTHDIRWFASLAIAICREAITARISGTKSAVEIRTRHCRNSHHSPGSAVTFDDSFTDLFMATYVSPQ